MSDPMTVMFGPQRCALCGKDHCRGTPCPEPARTAVVTKITVAGPRRMFVTEPSGRFVSAEAECAFVVWEQRNGWTWESLKQREGAITAFSAGWIAADEARALSSEAPPISPAAGRAGKETRDEP